MYSPTPPPPPPPLYYQTLTDTELSVRFVWQAATLYLKRRPAHATPILAPLTWHGSCCVLLSRFPLHVQDPGGMDNTEESRLGPRELQLALQHDEEILLYLLAQGAIEQNLFDEMFSLPPEEKAEKLMKEVNRLANLDQKYYQLLLQYMNSKWEYDNIVEVFKSLHLHCSQYHDHAARRGTTRANVLRGFNLCCCIPRCSLVAVTCIAVICIAAFVMYQVSFADQNSQAIQFCCLFFLQTSMREGTSEWYRKYTTGLQNGG